MEKFAHEKLYGLWREVLEQGNCKDYVNEMANQLELLGTETNTLTKQMVKDKLEQVLLKVKKSLEP
tara:strand:- start:1262 stop:1459 length:198 start_codon:yes stop_codon:yes gene_type:complete